MMDTAKSNVPYQAYRVSLALPVDAVSPSPVKAPFADRLVVGAGPKRDFTFGVPTVEHHQQWLRRTCFSPANGIH